MADFPKWVKSKKRRKILQGLRVAQAAKVGENNGQATHGARMVHARRTQAACAKKEERLNDGDNNGQATHGARKHAWRTQAAWATNYQEKSSEQNLQEIK